MEVEEDCVRISRWLCSALQRSTLAAVALDLGVAIVPALASCIGRLLL